MFKRIDGKDKDKMDHQKDHNVAAIIIVDHDVLTFLEMFDLLERQDKLDTVNFMARRLKKDENDKKK